MKVGNLQKQSPWNPGRLSRETIQEWWEYSKRRRWLEPVGSLWGLSEMGSRDLRAERERVNSPDPKRLASGVTRWVIPTSIVGFVGLAGGRYLVLEGAILVLAGAIIATLLLVAGALRILEPSVNRWFARRACDWLDGRPVRWAFGTNHQPADFCRLYAAHDRRASGFDHRQPTAESSTAQLAGSQGAHLRSRRS